MKTCHRIGLLAFLGVCCAGATGRAAGDDSRIATLEERVNSLETELKHYRNAPDPAVVDKVVADAIKRSSLLSTGGGAKAGYANGFFLADQDNKFQAKLNGFLYTRYLWNHADNSTAGADDDEFGFQVRRAELYLTGNAFGPKLFYQFGAGFDRATGSFQVISAYAGWQFDKHWEVRAGTFKPPFLIEELTSASKQQAAERSFVNAYFSAGISEGAQLQYSSDKLKVAAMVHDGSNAVDSEFDADKSDYAVAVRAEYKLAGDWPQFADFEGWNDGKLAARIGAAVDYEKGETGDSATVADYVKYTMDLSVEGRGWNVFLAGVGKHVQGQGAAPERDQYGLLAQAGVFVIPNRLELFGRYEYVSFDGAFNATATPIDDQVNLTTVGVNWFFLGHNAKVTSDVVYVWDALPAGSTGLGLLTSDDGPQVVFRTGVAFSF